MRGPSNPFRDPLSRRLLPLAYGLARGTGLAETGIWWSFPITSVMAAVTSALWFAQGGWKKTRLTEEKRQIAKVADEAILEEGIR